MLNNESGDWVTTRFIAHNIQWLLLAGGHVWEVVPYLAHYNTFTMEKQGIWNPKYMYISFYKP